MTNTESRSSESEYCFNCHHWRIAIPNLGGLVDQGVCALYCDKRFEDDTCGRWEQATEDDRAVFMICRRMINEHCDQHCKEVQKYAKEKFEEDMRERVMKVFGLTEKEEHDCK